MSNVNTLILSFSNDIVFVSGLDPDPDSHCVSQSGSKGHRNADPEPKHCQKYFRVNAHLENTLFRCGNELPNMSNITVFNLWPQKSFEFLSNSYVYKIDYESDIIRKNGGNECALLLRRNVIEIIHAISPSLANLPQREGGGRGNRGVRGEAQIYFMHNTCLKNSRERWLFLHIHCSDNR